MVFCVQLMPLPPHHLLLHKIQTGLTFLVPAYPGCPAKEAFKRASGVEYVCWMGSYTMTTCLEKGILTALKQISGGNLVRENCLLLTLRLTLHQCLVDFAGLLLPVFRMLLFIKSL